MNERPLEFILVRQKDNILAIVNQMQWTDTLDSLRTDCDTVANHLLILSELWVEADYAYKLTEICERLVSLLSEAYMKAENHKRRQGLGILRMRFIKLSDTFYGMQHEPELYIK
jgi:hypothetical protein|tara:strand:+ start:1231 stop:1572 length:342 start_codon:yes stop_codon:yes gene_type:complete